MRRVAVCPPLPPRASWGRHWQPAVVTLDAVLLAQAAARASRLEEASAVLGRALAEAVETREAPPLAEALQIRRALSSEGSDADDPVMVEAAAQLSVLEYEELVQAAIGTRDRDTLELLLEDPPCFAAFLPLGIVDVVGL